MAQYIKTVMIALNKAKFVIGIVIAIALIIFLSSFIGNNVFFNAENSSDTTASVPRAKEKSKSLEVVATEDSEQPEGQVLEAADDPEKTPVGAEHSGSRPAPAACDGIERAKAVKERADAIAAENKRHKRQVSDIRAEASGFLSRSENRIEELLQPEYDRHAQELAEIEAKFQDRIAKSPC